MTIGRAIFARGGEAVIRRGSYDNQDVAIRQFYSPEDIDWKTGAGEQALKVRSRKVCIALRELEELKMNEDRSERNHYAPSTITRQRIASHRNLPR